MIKMKTKLIKFILSFTDYDNIKKENESLKSVIDTLIEKPHSTESLIIIEGHRLKKQLIRSVWMGDTGRKLKKFDGILLKHITP